MRVASLALFRSGIGRESAYLDPGSGSFIIHLIIAGLVGAGFLLRGYWSKITTFFRGGNAETEDDDDEYDDDLDNA